MQEYPIVVGEDARARLTQIIAEKNPSQVVVFVDRNTRAQCYPLLKDFLPTHDLYEIPPGEIHKNLDTCRALWGYLTELQLDRKALVINLGGGVIGDMGGFVAATYKRGIDFIQVPTTLLAQVDASVGGKLGIDFRAYKNHIGVFQTPQAVIIYPPFLKTLPREELISGFAEVIKHHLIADLPAWNSLSQINAIESHDFTTLIEHSIAIKAQIVASDFKEQGNRKALNFGHTLGHAIESLHLEDPNEKTLLHGEAIAIGMIGESYISYKRGDLSSKELEDLQVYLLNYFPKVELTADKDEEIFQRMLQDKKNEKGGILCTLVPKIGTFQVNVQLEKQEIFSALAYYRQLS